MLTSGRAADTGWWSNNGKQTERRSVRRTRPERLYTGRLTIAHGRGPMKARTHASPSHRARKTRAVCCGRRAANCSLSGAFRVGTRQLLPTTGRIGIRGAGCSGGGVDASRGQTPPPSPMQFLSHNGATPRQRGVGGGPVAVTCTAAGVQIAETMPYCWASVAQPASKLRLVSRPPAARCWQASQLDQ